MNQFAINAELTAVLAECMENYDVGDASVEWPNNILSRHTVVYESGVVARWDELVVHNVSAEELALCTKIAREASDLAKGMEVGMGSESGDAFHTFFIANNDENEQVKTIDAAFIRAKFGGTIFPPATISVEPLAETGIWWSEVLYDCSEMEEDEQEEYLRPWRTLAQWFQSQTAFVDTAFVRIGDAKALSQLDENQWPEGTELTPSVLPRLLLGLTANGSLTGLFGFSVQT